ncbi:hypothetical protein REPUB_Repub03eG0155100 [Reevesia pubescens]
MNVYDSSKSQPGLTAYGGVLRDDNGMWICGFTCRIGIACTLISKLWAIYHGLHLYWMRSFLKVELETDSLAALQKIINKEARVDPHHHLIEAIRELQQCHWICTIKHVHRKSNTCANWMAIHFDHLSLGLHVFDFPQDDITSCLLAVAMGIAWPRLL